MEMEQTFWSKEDDSAQMFHELERWVEEEDLSSSADAIAVSPKNDIDAKESSAIDSDEQIESYVNLQDVDPTVPFYEYTHSTPDAIILNCEVCKRFCIAKVNLPDLALRPGPGDRSFTFRCAKCNGGKQSFKHNEKTWLDIALTALYNLEIKHSRRFFHVKKEVCKFVDQHWNELCLGRTRTATWWATLNAQITTRTDIFETESHGSGKWALRYSNLTCTGGGETRASSVLLKPEKRQRSRSKSDFEDRVQNSEEEASLEESEEEMMDDEFSRKERIIDKRMFQGRLQYLLRTEDGDEMWEDASTSKTDLIREYEEGIKRAARNIVKKNRQRRQKSYMFLWCHQCKQKHDDVVYCSRYFKGSCSKKYCVGCIQRHYGEDITDDNKESWVCLYCRNMCSCAFCRRRRGDETVPSEFGVSTVPRKAQKRKHHEIDEIKVTAEQIETILARIDHGDTAEYLVKLKDGMGSRWAREKEVIKSTSLLLQFDHGLKISVPGSVINSIQSTGSPQKKRRLSSLRTSSEVERHDVSLEEIVLPPKDKIHIPTWRDVPNYDDSFLPDLGLGLDEESVEDDSDEVYASRHARYEEEEQTRYREFLRAQRLMKASSKHRKQHGDTKVTLQDLLNSGLVNEGEELTFRDQIDGEAAKLSSAGTIEWRGRNFTSLSTLAKTMAHECGYGNHGTLFNGWLFIYARGKPMEHYRDQCRNQLLDVTFVVTDDIPTDDVNTSLASLKSESSLPPVALQSSQDLEDLAASNDNATTSSVTPALNASYIIHDNRSNLSDDSFSRLDAIDNFTLETWIEGMDKPSSNM
jgi:hypothetical protein